jgi:DNA polymerase I-like protein with 3'-5' exonuclease and polymerase domains
MIHTHNAIKQCEINAHQLAFVHDELQFECPPDYADTLSSALTLSALTAGEHYNLRVPIAAEAKVGDNWAEVH